MPWGAHACLFYESADDLLDTLVPYFSAGAGGNERCLWVVSENVTEAEAKAALSHDIPDLDRRLANGSVEILPGREWYRPEEDVDIERLICGWHAKLAAALEQGHDGLRISGDASWVEAGHSDGFFQYEHALSLGLAGRPMLVLCTYSAQRSRALDVINVTRAHQFTLARSRGEWNVIETPELKQAKQELVGLKTALEDRVRLRTGELAAANARLLAENHERERAEAALAEAQTELARAGRLTSLGVLAASIAHEVNQPLAAIVTNSEASMRLLASQPPNVAEASAALNQIAADARRAADVVRRVRDLAAGTGEQVDVDLNDAIREVIALLRSQLQGLKVEVRLALSPEAPHALGDRLQLQQAIMNMVINATEAMSEQSGKREVTLRSHVDRDGAVVLSIEDRGPGVAPEVLERLFDPFFTTKSGGMGMGLSIARSVAEAHGGRLSVSAGSAGGALFQLIIPNHGAAP